MNKAEYELGSWLSAALEDPTACDEFKIAVNNWFDMLNKKEERIRTIGVFAAGQEDRLIDEHIREINE